MSTDSHSEKRGRAQEIVDFLNSLFKIDPNTIHKLFKHHELTNRALAEHPTVQVLESEVKHGGLKGAPIWSLGILGILNGFVGVDDDSYGFIQMIEDDETEKLLGFRVAPLKSEDENQGEQGEL